METVREGTSVPSTVLNIAAGHDTGGQMIQLKHAFDQHSTAWRMVALATTDHRNQYPRDIAPELGYRTIREQVERLWHEADLVHIHRNLMWFAGLDKENRKPILLNHHGSALRAAPGEAIREAKHIGAVSAVSTIDLLAYDPDLVWLPAPFDLDALAALSRKRTAKVVRIAHAPTDRKIKSTTAIVAAVKKLSERYPIEFDLIEGVPWAECLRRKARADIFVDQLVLGYGCNAIETWGMGIPVVAGTTNPVTRKRMVEMLGELPFYEATADNLESRLEQLVADKALRTEWGKRGRAYVERWHAAPVVTAQVETLYQRAIAERKPVAMTRLSGGVRNRAIRVRDEAGRIRFMTPARARLRGFMAVPA